VIFLCNGESKFADKLEAEVGADGYNSEGEDNCPCVDIHGLIKPAHLVSGIPSLATADALMLNVRSRLDAARGESSREPIKDARKMLFG